MPFQQVYSDSCQAAMQEHALQHPHLHGPMHVCHFSGYCFSLQGSMLTHDLCCFFQGRPLKPRVYVPQEVWVIVCIHLLNLHIQMWRHEQGVSSGCATSRETAWKCSMHCVAAVTEQAEAAV